MRLLQIPHFLIRQLHSYRYHRLIDPLLTPQPDNRMHSLPSQHSRHCHLRHTQPFLPTHLLDTIHNCFVELSLSISVYVFESVVATFTGSEAAAPGTREDSAGEGRPENAAYAGGAAVGEHFALFFAIEEVVIILHGDGLVVLSFSCIGVVYAF